MGLFDRFFNAKAKEVTTEPTKKSGQLSKKTVPQQVYRFNSELKTWKNAVTEFEDVYHPINEDLIRIYNDITIDAHLSACIDARISRTTSKDFKVVDEKGEEIKEESELFKALWFRDFIKFALESKFFGFSLIQFGDLKGKKFDYVDIFPRQYVFPQMRSVRKYSNSNAELVAYDSPEFAPWVIGIGKPNDMGLLMKAAPLVIFKKTGLGSWTEFAEIFGAPFRMGKTDVRDNQLRQNMFDMLENMGRNAFGVFDKDDIIEFVRDNKTDSHNVFNELVGRTNSEISKLVLGSTMTMDDGSSRAQAEVHENTSAAINKEDAFFLLSMVNDELIPFLNAYHGFNISGRWVFDDTENTSKEEQFKIDIELVKNGFNVPKEYFTETYGTPIDEKEEPEPLDPENPEKVKGKKQGPEELENSIKKKTTLANIYDAFTSDGFLCGCNELNYEDAPLPVWSDEYIDEIIAGVHSGLYTLDKLPESLYLELGKRLEEGLYSGIGTNVSLNTLENPAYIKTLRNNIWTFSGAKTWQQINEMSAFLVDENGDPRSFKEYKDFAKKTFNQYNVNYLRTEINHAQGSGQMADKWQQIDDEKDIFPYLKYVTAGDERVRSSHKALNGVIKRVDSPFWNTNSPLNGWNCRCDLVQLDEAEETPDSKIEVPKDTPDYMKNNPGREVFGKEHPYFKVPKGFEDDKAQNFGLPKPPTVTNAQIISKIKPVKAPIQKEASVKIDLFKDSLLKKNYSSLIIEALNMVPKEARPNIIADFSAVGKMTERPFSAQQNRNYGVKISQDELIISEADFTPEMAAKYKHVKRLDGNYRILESLDVVAFNPRVYKTPKDILTRKNKIQELFKAKGEAYFIESALTEESFTIYHELGHIYDKNKRLTARQNDLHFALSRWHAQTKIGHLKINDGAYSEAFADAFADYFTTGGKNLPDYLLTELNKLLK